MAKTGTYALIASNTLGSAQATVTFGSIPGTFTDLVLVITALSANTAAYNMKVVLNSDTANNYSNTILYGDGSAATSSRAYLSQPYFRGSYLTGPTSTTYQNAILSFQDYSNATTYKTILTRANNTGQGTEGIVSLWRSTAAITNIDISLVSGSYNTGSTFFLYVIQAGNI